MSKRKVAFILFGSPAHIYHAAPIAFELSKMKDISVTIYTSSLNNLHIIHDLSSQLKNNCKCELSYPSLFYKLKNKLQKTRFPSASSIIQNNVNSLLKNDVIISPDCNIRRLKEASTADTIFINCMHGAGDGAYGFTKALKDFNLILASGPEIKNRLIQETELKHEQVSIGGYCKFDLIDIFKKNKPTIFNNQSPIFLYNPHFKPELSSWFDWGIEVLKFFKNTPSANLIFAPHIMLNNSGTINIPDEFLSLDNIHIDLGSHSLIDMSYTIMADIYIGDVSSQVYEFLHKSKPCLFLNNKNINWENNSNYKMWYLGDVAKKIEEIPQLILDCQMNHIHYKEKQKEIFKQKFHLGKTSAGIKSAEIIYQFMLRR